MKIEEGVNRFRRKAEIFLKKLHFENKIYSFEKIHPSFLHVYLNLVKPWQLVLNSFFKYIFVDIEKCFKIIADFPLNCEKLSVHVQENQNKKMKIEEGVNRFRRKAENLLKENCILKIKFIQKSFISTCRLKSSLTFTCAKRQYGFNYSIFCFVRISKIKEFER